DQPGLENSGLALPPPCSRVFHNTFSPVLPFQVNGRSFSSVYPSPVGPRHAGQSPAWLAPWPARSHNVPPRTRRAPHNQSRRIFPPYGPFQFEYTSHPLVLLSRIATLRLVATFGPPVVKQKTTGEPPVATR